jgi:hypothetical protein
MRGLEEQLQSREVVLEAFLLEATGHLEPSLDEEDADAAYASEEGVSDSNGRRS